MNRRPPLDDGLGEHFSRREALELGTSVSRLRALDLSVPFRGARSRGSEAAPGSNRWEQERAELIERCAAFVPIAPPGFAFSHGTAAALHGVPVPPRVRRPSELHVVVPRGVRAPRRSGIVGHTSNVVQVIGVRGLPLVVPALAWLQLGPMLTLDELIVAGDGLVRRKRALATLDELCGLVLTAAHARGIRRLRAALGEVRSGTDSPQESRLRVALVRAGLPEPVVHVTVHHDGYFVGTPDLAYVAERIAIEYQGEQHRDDADVFEDDILRHELFRRAGWHVLLVTARRLRFPELLAEEVRALLAERAPGRS